jgi:hypothetical protein
MFREQAEKLLSALEAAVPKQDEQISGYLLRWAPSPKNGIQIHYQLSAYTDIETGAKFSNTPADVLRRLLELTEALDKWAANEGPWPLAKPMEAT